MSTSYRKTTVFLYFFRSERLTVQKKIEYFSHRFNMVHNWPQLFELDDIGPIRKTTYSYKNL